MQLKQASLSLVQVKGFAVLIFINLFLGIASSFVGPYNSLFGIDEVGMSNIAFGVFMMLTSICGVFINTLIGRLSDFSINRRSLLLISAFAGTIGYIGFAFNRNYTVLLLISMFIIGIASSSFAQIFAYSRESIASADIDKRDIPLYMNVFRMFFALSWTVGPAIASLVLLKFHFTGLYLVAALFYFVIMMTTLLFLKSDPKTSVQVGARAKSKLSQYVFRPYIMANLGAFTLIQGAMTMAMMDVSLFVTRVLHASDFQIGIIFSIPPIFEVPFMLAFGVIATKIDNKILIRIGVLISVVYFSTFLFVTAPWQIYIFQILSAAYVSVTNGIAISYFQDFIPGEPGTATALYGNTSAIGRMIGSLLFGIVTAAIGYRLMYVFPVAFTAVALILLVLFGNLREEDKLDKLENAL